MENQRFGDDGLKNARNDSAAQPVGVESAVRVPYDRDSFMQIRIPETWQKYNGRLSWGRGQCLSILDDGCDLSDPLWQVESRGGRK